MNAPLSKSKLRAALGFTTDAQLVEWFAPISAAAISQWKDHAPIPEARWLFAQLKRPDLFQAAAATDPAPLAGVGA